MRQPPNHGGKASLTAQAEDGFRTLRRLSERRHPMRGRRLPARRDNPRHLCTALHELFDKVAEEVEEFTDDYPHQDCHLDARATPVVALAGRHCDAEMEPT